MMNGKIGLLIVNNGHWRLKICNNLSHDSSMNKVVDGGEALLQAKAHCPKSDAVREGDIPDHSDHEGEDAGGGHWS